MAATRSDELTRVLKLAYEAKNFDATGANMFNVLMILYAISACCKPSLVLRSYQARSPGG